MNSTWAHQEQGIKFLDDRKGCGALIWEPGCGKTRTIIEYVRQRRIAEPDLKVLVVCSISLIDRVWIEEIKNYSSFTAMNCHEEGFPEIPTDFMVVNWDTVRSRRDDYRKEQNQNLIQLRKLLSQHRILCVLDESTKIKSYNSDITKTMLELAPLFAGRIIMSGTPTPNSVLEWWSQINFVKPFVLGSSYSQFKNTYSTFVRNGVAVPQGAFLTRAERAKMFKTGGKEVVFPHNEKKIMELVSPYCMKVLKSECHDLPEQIDQYREVEMTAKQSRVYRDMKEELVAYLTDLFEEGSGSASAAVAMNALTMTAKLRQVPSGFIIDEKGQEVDLGGSPKMQALEELVDDAEGQQIMVFGNFKWEIERISKVLEKHGPVSTLYGETKDKAGSIEAFQKGDSRFFVCHPRSAAHGLNLQNCSMAVFFSLSYSCEEYEQARGRIHRPGQKNNCVYVHLLAKNTIDQDILQIVQGKQTSQQMLLSMIPRRIAA